MSLFLFVGAAVAWGVLPLLPALRELFWPTDTDPLTVVGRDAGDVAYFARRFREYLLPQVQWTPADQGHLPDGTAVLHLGAGPLPSGAGDRVVLAGPGAELPAGITWRQEVYGAGDLTLGAGAACRAVLGEGDLRLGAGARVFRWAHAVGRLEAGDGAVLHGRASSDAVLRLGDGVRFERVAAPRIEVGEPAWSAPPAPEGLFCPWEPPAGATRVGDHWRLRGPVRIPPGCRVEGPLVVTGSLEIGERALVVGHLKAHGRLAVGVGARVEGSLVTRGRLEVGAGCTVRGPVLAEGHVSIVGGAIIGEAAQPTTVSGRRVELGTGAVLHGVVAAQEGGVTGRGPEGGPA